MESDNNQRMKFCAIIPDRGDRPELTANCFRMLDRMTLKPDKIYHINFEPFSDEPDLVPRVMSGVQQAKEDGIDLCFIVENDDYYPADYFEKYQQAFAQFDFFGQNHTNYYNIKTLRWTLFDGTEHKYRSSLFTTGFKISALNMYKWPKPEEIFLDINLWKYARFRRRFFINTGAIGIKHGIGKCGGKGHQMKLHNYDPEFEFLQRHVDHATFNFYIDLHFKLKSNSSPVPAMVK